MSPRRPGSTLPIGLVLWAGLLAGACQQAVADLPPPPPQVQVLLDEYRITAPNRLAPGRVLLDVRNTGAIRHSLTVVRLPDDFPGTFEEHHASGEQQALPTIVVLSARPPGERDLIALDLTAGRYGLFCTLRDEDGTPHSHKGMAAQMRVN